MLARRTAFLCLLVFLAATFPSNLRLVFAEGQLPKLTFVCQDGTWEDEEYCGRDAVTATGGWPTGGSAAPSSVPDMNHDCIVNGLDWALFVPEYAGGGATGPVSADFNGDQMVTPQDYSYMATRTGHTAVPCNPTAVPVVCDGVLALSWSSNPNTIVDNANFSQFAVADLYVVVSGVTNARWVEFSVKHSPNVQVAYPPFAEPGEAISFPTCNGLQNFAVWLDTPVTGSGVAFILRCIVMNTLPAYVTVAPQTCPLTRNRWLTGEIPQVSHEFSTVSSAGINGPTPGVTPSCTSIGTVTGNVYSDVFADCLFNANDTFASGRRMVAVPGPYFAFTDNAGNYSFTLSAGTYWISMANYNDPWKKLSVCQEPVLQVEVTADNVTSGVNFALQPFGTIKGRVYRDLENTTQCTFDGQDFAIPSRVIQATPGGYMTMSDKNGNYELDVPPGSYTVTQMTVQNDPWASQTCSTGSYSVVAPPNATAAGNDFPLRIVAPTGCAASVNIISQGVVLSPPPCQNRFLRGPCPGNEQEYYVVVGNGVLTSTPIAPNSVVDVTLDPTFTIGSVTSDANYTVVDSPSPNRRLIRFNQGINPGATEVVVIRATPTGGGPYTHGVSYDAAGTCATVTASLSEVSACSCDPNDMVVQPGCGLNNEVLPGKTMTYTVRFENVGSGPAHNVYISDVLDADLDPTSVFVVSASHTVTGVQIDPGNKLVISFDGIELAAASALPANKGYVIFSVHQDPSLSDGTTITNSAAITFDFNEPVVTNTVTSTVKTNPCSTTGVDTPAQPLSHYMGQNYPNPFNPATTIDYALASPERVSIAVYNVRGELIRMLVSERKPAGWYSVEWDGRDQHGNPVASGVYVSRMQAGSFTDSKKLILLK